MKELLNPAYIVAALLYSVMGLAVFAATFVAVDKLTPYDLWHEIVAKQNRALATILGCLSLGISIIIAAAIHG